MGWESLKNEAGPARRVVRGAGQGRADYNEWGEITTSPPVLTLFTFPGRSPICWGAAWGAKILNI